MIMSQHEKFETWFGGEYGDDHDDTGISFERKGDGYLHQGVDDAWNVWRASRHAAFEAAAKVCEEMVDGWNQTAQGATDGRYDFMTEAGDRCSDEILALDALSQQKPGEQ
jgi:hypothetical protein